MWIREEEGARDSQRWREVPGQRGKETGWPGDSHSRKDRQLGAELRVGEARLRDRRDRRHTGT